MKSNATTDCNGIPYPVFTNGTVIFCESVKGAKPKGSVFCLKLATFGKNARLPLPGQFFMLRSEKSQQILARPISVFHSEEKSFPVCGTFSKLSDSPCDSDSRDSDSLDSESSCEQKKCVELSFLILLKGKGTKELCSLKANDKVQVLGPLGNVFPRPETTEYSEVISTDSIIMSKKCHSELLSDGRQINSESMNKEELKEPVFQMSGLQHDTKSKKVLLIGGGIGVAPVANFAESLLEKSYDFIASFKSGSYGLENIRPQNLTITTDDGSVGIKGMVTAAIDAEKLKAGEYSAVYACGPAPMLNCIKNISEEAGVQCWLSMESRMACGVGVCLGCVIPTAKGNLRCCKDGPVFDSKILSFPKPKPSLIKMGKVIETINKGGESLPLASNTVVSGFRESQPPSTTMFSATPSAGASAPATPPNLSVTINGVRFQNPLIGSSGTFGFGTEYATIFDVNRLGGIASKGLTLEASEGNSGIRVWETPSGLMNSIGLQNPGIPHFIEHELPEMLKLKPVVIANLSGSSLETYVEGAKLLEKTQVPIIELNISCPNVSAGGAAFGMKCSSASTVVSAVRSVMKKPLWVKLTPQSPELNEVALACIDAGADAISLCNSFQGVAIDVETGRPIFDKVKAGFGGPAVRPIAVRLIYELYDAIKTLPKEKQVPIIAIGGIATWQDVIEFIMAGATACEVGTNTFANPFTMIECIDGIEKYMVRKGITNLEQIRGISHF